MEKTYERNPPPPGELPGELKYILEVVSSTTAGGRDLESCAYIDGRPSYKLSCSCFIKKKKNYFYKILSKNAILFHKKVFF